MAKFPEAEQRRFKNVFICRVCKSKLKAPSMKVIQGAVLCRNCGAKQLRTIRKK